jgi:GAG-pre-integrase domain
VDEPVSTTNKDIDVDSEASAALLRWHCRLSHISITRLQLMAGRGQIPLRLAKCKIPVCQSCLFGKAIRRPWRTRQSSKPVQGEKISEPGECVSVDQLEASTPGPVAQMKCRLITDRYTVATVYVDHYSDLSYVYLKRGTSARRLLTENRSFKDLRDRMAST